VCASNPRKGTKKKSKSFFSPSTGTRNSGKKGKRRNRKITRAKGNGGVSRKKGPTNVKRAWGLVKATAGGEGVFERKKKASRGGISKGGGS